MLFVSQGENDAPGVEAHEVICPDCCQRRKIDFGHPRVEAWGVDTNGWTSAPVCDTCRTAIPVVVDGGTLRLETESVSTIEAPWIVEEESLDRWAFMEANADGLTLAERRELWGLAVGATFEGGGGAAPRWRVTRTA